MIFLWILLALVLFILVKTGAFVAVLSWILTGILNLIVGIFTCLWNAVLYPVLCAVGQALLSLFAAIWPWLAIVAVIAALVLVVRGIFFCRGSRTFTSRSYGSGCSGASDSLDSGVSCLSGSSYSAGISDFPVSGSSSYAYVGNRRSKVVHYAYDSAVYDMSDRNKVYFSSYSMNQFFIKLV